MLQNFSFQSRAKSLHLLSQKTWDLVVIGGGITGAAVARDAALRGMQVALVEMNDFASGTSSGSTKLIHGGLRYLENFEFGLVKEAIHERELLRKLYAPLIEDLEFVFPTYAKQPPARWKLNIGLFLYDWFAKFREKHRNYSAKTAAEIFPLLERQNLSGACVYTDSFAEDYRLVTELIKSAVRLGAQALSRVEVLSLRSLEAGETQIHLRDRLHGGEPFTIKSKVVCNCTGPWSDRIRQTLGLPPVLKITQGVHILVKRDKLPVDKAYVLSDPELHRIIFAIPWGASTYLGTTDTSLNTIEDARAGQMDIDYILKIANRYFQKKVEQKDIHQSWAAVRPLIQPNDSVSNNSQISREHEIQEQPVNIFHILGGKLTSHRVMAEECLDLFAGRIGFGKSKTNRIPLQEAFWNLSQNSNDLLARSYGRFASDIYRLDKELKLNRAKLHSQHTHLVAEVYYAIHHEMALEPLDYLRRRSSLYYLTDIKNPEDQQLLEKILQIFSDEMKWSPEEFKVQKKRLWASYEWDREGYSCP